MFPSSGSRSTPTSGGRRGPIPSGAGRRFAAAAAAAAASAGSGGGGGKRDARGSADVGGGSRDNPPSSASAHRRIAYASTPASSTFLDPEVAEKRNQISNFLHESHKTRTFPNL